MKRNKKSLTRKQKAFRRLGGALALLILTAFLMPGSLTLTQSLRGAERDFLIHPTEVIDQQELGPYLFYLSANEDILFLSGHRLVFPDGWWGFPSFALDLPGEEPVSALVIGGSAREKGWYHKMVIGAVSLEEAVSVRLCDAYISNEQGRMRPSDETWTGDVLEAETGLRYFWFGQEMPSPDDHIEFLALEVLDEAGNVLYTHDLTNDQAGYFG